MIIVQEGGEASAASLSPLLSTFDYHSRVERNQVYPLIDKNQSTLTCHQCCDMGKHDLWSANNWTWKFIRKQGSYDKQGTDKALKRAFPSVTWKVNDHINVKGDKTPFDGDLIYWAKRENKNYSGMHTTLLKAQNQKCNACGLLFLSGDKVEIHHIDGYHDNWKKSNLELLHRHCHQHKPVHTAVRVARNLTCKGRK